MLTKQRVFQQLQLSASRGENMLSGMGGPNTCIWKGNDSNHMVHVYCHSVIMVILHVNFITRK